MVKVVGEAVLTIESEPATVWVEAISLGRLKGWDKIVMTEPPTVDGGFLLTDDQITVSCLWTRVNQYQSLEWVGDDGTEGRLTLGDQGATTSVSYFSVGVPRHASDKFAVGLLKVVAAGKAKRESNKDSLDELKRLARRVALRQDGHPVDDRAPRQMLDVCDFGAGTIDTDTVPLFDDHGRLVLESDEVVLRSVKAKPAAEAAKAASGSEDWQTMWQSSESGDLTLTDRRLVYDIRNFARGDVSWLVVGGAIGPMLAGASHLRARSQRSGRTAAGQIRHHQVVNLTTGEASRPTFSTESTVTATMIELPDRAVRVSLNVADGAASALDLARTWTRSAAAYRMARFPDLAEDHPADWSTLSDQRAEPSSSEGFHGDAWWLPLACGLGRTRPISIVN
jgi:hypothetical protein